MLVNSKCFLRASSNWNNSFGQSITLKQYPAELSLTALICFMGMVEGAIAALVMERDMSAWAIGFDSRLLAAVYSVSTTLCKCRAVM